MENRYQADTDTLIVYLRQYHPGLSDFEIRRIINNPHLSREAQIQMAQNKKINERDRQMEKRREWSSNFSRRLEEIKNSQEERREVSAETTGESFDRKWAERRENLFKDLRTENEPANSTDQDLPSFLRGRGR